MTITISLFAFIFGTIIGSGLNALDYRVGTNKSWLADRSQCPDCGHKLSCWELVPIISFLYLGGKCSECGESISWQYPLVELAAGLLFVLIVQTIGVSPVGVFAAVVWSILLFIYIYDGRTMIVPGWAVWLFNLLALTTVFVPLLQPEIGLVGTSAVSAGFVLPSWIKILAGPILAAPFALIWFVSGGRAMGLADAKLALGIGWLLGLADGLSAVMFAFWIGAVVSLGLLAFQHLWKSNSQDKPEASTMEGEALTMKSAVPFGPFLILGLLLVYFTGLSLL